MRARPPHDAELPYETACAHNRLRLEPKAVPFDQAALAGELGSEQRRSADLGLGSTLRVLGRWAESQALFAQGPAQYPDATKLHVFAAMTAHNQGRPSEAAPTLRGVIARTSSDPALTRHARAIAFCAQDIDRTWP